MASLDQMWAALNDGSHNARRQQIIKEHDANHPGLAYMHNPAYKAEYDKRREDLFAFKQKLNKEGGGWYGSKYHLESKKKNRAIKAAAGIGSKSYDGNSGGGGHGKAEQRRLEGAHQATDVAQRQAAAAERRAAKKAKREARQQRFAGEIFNS